jgi:bifunctional non-homologous end joining protein LigD
MRPAAQNAVSLDDLDRAGWWSVRGERVHVTDLDQVLLPGPPPLTKRDVIRYYAEVAPYLLSYLEGRAVTVDRYPGGVAETGFRPDGGLGTVPALVGMANLAGIELHALPARLTSTREPTWALVDIVPGETTTAADVVELARVFHTALTHLGVTAMPNVTGTGSVRIWIPVRAGYTFDDTRVWAGKLSRIVGRVRPDLVSGRWYHRTGRRRRAWLDYTRNAIDKTLLAPFSIRPMPHAPVSVPIEWSELDDPDLRPDRWTVHTVLDRLRRLGDPLAPLIGRQQALPAL